MRRRDYSNVETAQRRRISLRAAATWLALAMMMFVGAMLVLRTLGESAAQLRAALAVAATLERRNVQHDERAVSVTPPPTRSVAPLEATPRRAAEPVELERALELKPELEGALIAGSAGPEPEREAASAGPPSGAAFARLLESGLLDGEADPDTAEALRRALETAGGR